MTVASRFALHSRRVCTPRGVVGASLIIEGELIAAVVEDDDPQSHDRLRDVPHDDLGNLVISPGIIDTHVHVNEPGRSDWEGFRTATQAAIAGGVTTIVDMPLNSSPVTTNVAALDQKRAAAQGKCWCDVGFYGGLIPENASRLEPLLQAGVLGIKTFLCDSGLDEFPASSEADLRQAMPTIAEYNAPLLVHAEITDRTVERVSDDRSYDQYLRSRPDRWEFNAIAMLIRLCESYETPIHVVHLSTATALDVLADAKRRNLPITVETCPHYLNFEAEQIEDADTRFKCAPPIRSSTNRHQLLQALASTIDTIGSDHSPCPPHMKHQDSGSFTSAWGGISSVQLTLPALWTSVRDRGVCFTRVAELLSTNPARLIRCADRKGAIRAGLAADLCIWDPDASWTVEPAGLFHRHPICPYEGRTLFGVVQRTYLRGRQVTPEQPPLGKILD